MFLRFTITRQHEDSKAPQGAFVAAYSLLESGELTKDEWKRLQDLLNWFSANLPHPPDSFDASRAIFWFKSGAHESISRMWDLIHLLQQHGHHIQVHKCARLANIAYQDKYQVAAFPSDRDGRITVR